MLQKSNFFSKNMAKVLRLTRGYQSSKAIPALTKVSLQIYFAELGRKKCEAKYTLELLIENIAVTWSL